MGRMASNVGVGVGQDFTTRPELTGSFGMVASTHWLATSVGMRMLELGGNAFDAATAAGFVLHVVQPHLNGPGGDLPAIVWDQSQEAVEVLCAQGIAPAAASIDRLAQLGVDSIPGTGLLAPCVPGAVDGWLRLLQDRGSLPLRDVLEPAIYYARHGYRAQPELTHTIAAVQEIFERDWPDSASAYLVNGQPPRPGTLVRNSALADVYERLVSTAEAAARGRVAQVAAARDAFYRGFVAEAIDSYLRTAQVADASGNVNRGLLTGEDLARWSATWEPAVSYDFRGVTVCKPGPWSQGPVLLQQLALLAGSDLAALDPDGPDYIHTLVEASKLAFADRGAWYADPDFADVPIDTLLSAAYNAERRGLIGQSASLADVPGHPDGRRPVEAAAPATPTGSRSAGVGEPTVHVGDTCHVDVVDRFGNMVSATPSGGWLQSSPVIPGLGFALGTRMQMFELRRDHPNALAPGKRPRTTLSPSLALRDGRPWLAFGTPGGDQQDQWSLQFFLNVAVFGDNLQRAVDRRTFHSAHWRSSFHPHEAHPGRLYIEDRIAPATVDELRRRGHDVHMTGPWSLTRLTAVGREPDGALRAAANPRGMEGYAVGR